MFRKRHEFTLEQVTGRLVLKSWWASLAILPLANRLVVLVANYTEYSPNQITLVSCCFRLLSAGLFLHGEHWALVMGGFCYQLAYLIDCVDGPVARLKGSTSEFGRYLDHLSDLFGDLLVLAALAWGQSLLFTPLVFAMAFMHIAESYVSYLSNMVLADKQPAYPQGKGTIGKIFKGYHRYREFFFSRNYKSFLSFPDYVALTFFIFPVLGAPVLGLKVGFVVLLGTTLYTVLSTFVSIHSGVRQFP